MMDLAERRPEALETVRRSAKAKFTAVGFPKSTDEAWRFTNPEPIAKTDFAPAAPISLSAPELASLQLAAFDSYRMVFANGRFLPALSVLPPGVTAGPLAFAGSEEGWLQSLLEENGEGPFGILATASFQDGAVVRVAAGTRLDRPLHLLYVAEAGTSPSSAHFRVVVELGAGASAALVEEFTGRGEGVFFTNAVTQARLAEGSSLEHTTLLREPVSFYHVRELRARLGRNARLSAHAVCLGGALVRADASVRLEAEGADCELNGLYLAAGRQHFDFHTHVDHVKPHGASRELYKGVLDGQARVVFNGLIEVQPNAQKTEAVVYNKNLLLSEEGLVNTKPEFKISANDVQCKHGATIGQLSADALFYMRSRGIGPAQARSLLVFGFASEMLGRLSLEPLRDALSAGIQRLAGMETA